MHMIGEHCKGRGMHSTPSVPLLPMATVTPFRLEQSRWAKPRRGKAPTCTPKLLQQARATRQQALQPLTGTYIHACTSRSRRSRHSCYLCLPSNCKPLHALLVQATAG